MSDLLNTTPNFRAGDKPTALQWNTDFGNKVDAADGFASGLTIDGGQIDNTAIDNCIIGGLTPANAKFLVLNTVKLDPGFPVGGNLSIDINGVLQASGSLGVSSIVFATGLSGGTITSSGTVGVLYGTTAGTAAQGNDARFATIPTQPANLPLQDGTASIGVSTSFARMDHVHPTDTTRAPIARPNFTGGAVNQTDPATARYDMIVSGAGPDSKITDLASTSTQFIMQFVNDAFNIGGAFMVATRSGVTVTQLDLYGPTINLHGNVQVVAGTLIGYQPSLGFTPVQQSGGAFQAGNKIYLGWDGASIRAQVDASDLGEIALQSWVNPNFATYAYVNAVNSNTINYANGTFKNINAYTPNQNVDAFQNVTFGTVVCGSFVTTSTDQGTWAIYHYAPTGNIYIRYQGLFDYGPIVFASDARLKRDITPAMTDCLGIVQRFKVQQFRWKNSPPDAPLIEAGLVTQQLKEIFPAVVNQALPDAPHGTLGDIIHYESVNLPAMCALLVGAVQQLSAQIAELKAAPA